jgi:hypothetical protein
MGNSLLLFSGALPVILLYYTIVLCDLYDNFSKKTKKYATQTNHNFRKLYILHKVFASFHSNEENFRKFYHLAKKRVKM